MENLKIEKGKTYTYEELKEIYRKAMMQTLDKPFGEIEDKELKEKSEDPQLVISTMLSGMVILHTMEDNLFVKEEKENV